MGHVFVVRGDLMQIACDAWLVPGGRGGPGFTWKQGLPLPGEWHTPAPDWFDHERSMLLASTVPPEPLPFLTDITGNNRDSPAWFVEGARAFVRLAARTLKDLERAPLFGRSKHLLALPLLGTGGGGGGT